MRPRPPARSRRLSLRLIASIADDAALNELVTLGLHHEQQHRELPLTAIKHALSVAPPVKVDAQRPVALTTQSQPEAATHWSTRKMGALLGVSASTVMRHWQANGLKPHIVRGFKVSRDPKFVEKLEDLVGLYMSPPEHALALCCDERSQVQALDSTQPDFPIKKGRAQTTTHDHAVRCAERIRRTSHRPMSAATHPPISCR